MVALPSLNLTVDAIYRHYENRPDEPRRTYLGGSEIGYECRRRLWYSFRWVRRPSFQGRILRLFDTGHREEIRIIENLRSIGVEVGWDQLEISSCDGHFKGHIDGAVLGLMESPKTWHLLECKTMNKKQFDELLRKGVKQAKPVHYAQCQVYMGELGLARAVYFVQCKDDDRLHMERIKYEKAEHSALIVKAKYVISAESPPDRISNDPSFFKCKFCDYSDFCHGREFPDVNCRTCAHSSTVGGGKWECARELEMNDDCDEHIFLPPMIHWATPVDGDSTWVEYKEGFVNSAATGFSTSEFTAFSSKQLRGGGV